MKRKKQEFVVDLDVELIANSLIRIGNTIACRAPFSDYPTRDEQRNAESGFDGATIMRANQVEVILAVCHSTTIRSTEKKWKTLYNIHTVFVQISICIYFLQIRRIPEINHKYHYHI